MESRKKAEESKNCLRQSRDRYWWAEVIFWGMPQTGIKVETGYLYQGPGFNRVFKIIISLWEIKIISPNNITNVFILHFFRVLPWITIYQKRFQWKIVSYKIEQNWYYLVSNSCEKRVFILLRTSNMALIFWETII